MLPEIVDVNMPAEGVFHNLVIVSIHKRYPGHARKVMQALWGMGLMMLAKTIVVVSAHVNVHDYEQVFFTVCANVDPKRDVLASEGPLDQLDHAAVLPCYGGKLGIDATHKLLEEGAREWPELIEMTPEVRDTVDRRWEEYGIGVQPASNGRISQVLRQKVRR
jgi:4-hydroxy-3-polyprenylbenzoate decarboxylase